MVGLYGGPSVSKLLPVEFGGNITTGFHINAMMTKEMPWFFSNEIGFLHTSLVNTISPGSLNEFYLQFGGRNYILDSRFFFEGLTGLHYTTFKKESLLDDWSDLIYNVTFNIGYHIPLKANNDCCVTAFGSGFIAGFKTYYYTGIKLSVGIRTFDFD